MASPSAGPPSTTRPESKDGSKDDEKDLGIEPVTTTEMEYTEEDYKKLTRKIDRYLIPTMFFMYGIQQTDKTSISIQALFGMNTELGLHGQQYQWLTTIFYITYLVGEFPSTWLLQRYNLGRVLTAYMVGWSICLLCISACNNWAQLMGLRALQGFFECNISPGFLLITGAWYRTSEHAQRSLFWQSSQGFFTITCNLILYGIARHAVAKGDIAAWRIISLFLGGLTLIGSIFCYFVLGMPQNVPWLTEVEKRMAIARVSQNQIGEETANKAWNWDHVWECFKDPQVYFGFFNTFLACIPNGGITTFSSLLYVTFGFDTWQSMLWGLPRNGIVLPIPVRPALVPRLGYLAIYVIVFILVAWYLRKFQNQRMFIMIISCILPFVGMLVMSLMPNTPEHKWLKWGMFDITVVFSLSLFLGWSLITSNIAGTTKRTVVSSMTLIAYCGGNMVGAQVFQTKDAPRYVGGTIACSACFGLQILVIICWRLWYMRENRRRDRALAESDISEEGQQRLGSELGKRDTTDLKNPYFRYAM
ncbi:putative transporter [Colletotrichum siamense]|nr:putative transporter [Colletotrichum siamense]